MKLLLKWPWHNQIAAMTLHQKIGFKFKPHCPKSRRQICDRSAMEGKKKKTVWYVDICFGLLLL